MLGHLRDRRLVGGFLIGGSVFFGFIGIFTYLPYYLSAAPFGLSTGSISAIYLVYGAGVLTSIVVGNLSGRFGRRALMATGFLIAAGAAALSLVPVLPVVILSLVVLCVGMFFVQGTAPAFVNATAREAKGGANALYTTFYYVGATFGSVLPGYAWQALGWPGVVAACLLAFGLGLLADLVLCA
jgi:YNFM family putative membrane transporter